MIATLGPAYAGRVLKIGTRGSPLALAQATETKNLIEKHFPDIEVKIQEIMTTVSSKRLKLLILVDSKI
jgi:porphobilinogen deaminase